METIYRVTIRDNIFCEGGSRFYRNHTDACNFLIHRYEHFLKRLPRKNIMNWPNEGEAQKSVKNYGLIEDYGFIMKELLF